MADSSKSSLTAGLDKWAADPERWSSVGRMGYDPDAPQPSMKGDPMPKKGSYTVPKMCAGGKVMKSWSNR